jgi:hypothetical protein
MIGQKLVERRSGDEHVVTGVQGGAWIIARTTLHGEPTFRAPYAVTTAHLAADFEVVVPPVDPEADDANAHAER